MLKRPIISPKGGQLKVNVQSFKPDNPGSGLVDQFKLLQGEPELEGVEVYLADIDVMSKEGRDFMTQRPVQRVRHNNTPQEGVE